MRFFILWCGYILGTIVNERINEMKKHNETYSVVNDYYFWLCMLAYTVLCICMFFA